MNTRSDITKIIGNTPLVHIRTASRQTGARLYGKLEFFNPLSSVKDRIGFAMIEDGLQTGKISPGSVIVEPTSGNTGIAGLCGPGQRTETHPDHAGNPEH